MNTRVKNMRTILTLEEVECAWDECRGVLLTFARAVESLTRDKIAASREAQRIYFDQAVEMLEQLAEDQDRKGNNSQAEGARASAHVLREMLAEGHAHLPVQQPDGTITLKLVSQMKPDDLVVIDGPDAFKEAEQAQKRLEAEIEAAGGFAAWRAMNSPAPLPALPTPHMVDQHSYSVAYTEDQMREYGEACRSVPSGFVIARETAIHIPPGDRPELCYAVIEGVGVFATEEAARAAHRHAMLPLGWVIMPVTQLLPGVAVRAQGEL